LSYLSTLGYYDGGYMTDWINYIARKKNINKISIDILNQHIYPNECDIKPLRADLDKLTEILHKELLNNGFEIAFIKKAVLNFEIPIENPKIKHTIYCSPFLEDANGKTYKPKKRITETAYEINFNPLNKYQ
jgi:hypothetical protein